MHRTTIILETALERKLKGRARHEEKSVTELIKNYIRSGLNRQKQVKAAKTVKLPSFSMGHSPVDPADRNQLWDLMDNR